MVCQWRIEAIEVLYLHIIVQHLKPGVLAHLQYFCRERFFFVGGTAACAADTRGFAFAKTSELDALDSSGQALPVPAFEADTEGVCNALLTGPL